VPCVLLAVKMNYVNRLWGVEMSARTSSMVKCDRCRKQEARVYRRLTQQKLCVRCYTDYLHRQVKRNIASLKIKEPRVPIAVPFHPMFPRESILLADIVAEIEERYNNTLQVLVMGESGRNVVRYYLESRDNIIVDSIDPARVPNRMRTLLENPSSLSGAGLITSWRFYRGVLASILSSRAGSVLVLPSCMDFLVLLELSSLLQGRLEGLGEAVESFEHPTAKLTFVNGFYGVPCIETTLVSRLLVGPMDFEYTKPFDPRSVVDRYALYVLEDAARERSYEIIFSTHRLLGYMRGGELGRCRFCGGLASNDTCYWCLKVLGREEKEG